MKSLGICLGASTISLVVLTKNKESIEIESSINEAHEGNPRRVLLELLSQIPNLGTLKIGATGRKFKKFLALSSIAEPEAVELACSHVLPDDHQYKVVISAGGETIMVYHLDDDGRVQNIHTGNKCASGTGEFFLQQLGRMSISLDEVSQMEMPEKLHKVSGRCSVFCKSDCTHALNKGVPKDEVVAGLSKMMAGKILELLKKFPKESIILTGGCHQNQAMVHYLREEIDDLYIPREAPAFEALGAGLWALENPTVSVSSPEQIFVDHTSRLSFLKPITDFKQMVEYKEQPRGVVLAGDKTILGLDVGSTTTKGVIMRRSDKAILAADYLRTNGDPVGASREVYRSLADQLDVPIAIEGLGVTGSGRQIAGLHAMTDGVINEIIAHATGAVYFDPQVDTIFEIGGQDAKYTYITNGVPSDYAMNEACSAGTGSFLEESAKESLGVDVTDIGDTAFKAQKPPNFNDQCAAFIGSDIKGAAQEDVPLPDIVAGLVYSICMNYTNRVKGNRPVGKKVFIQGGVCYNQAIPAAMAALTGKKMVVPPEPGLVGAFGVALEVERRMEKGLLTPDNFNLVELAERDVSYDKSFICGGGKDCDRGCEIARIKINDKVYPFGGICNRFDNLIHQRKVKTEGLNLVNWRQKRVYRDLSPEEPQDTRPTVGMNRTFLIHTYFPFYNQFFSELGFRLVLPDKMDQAGIDQQGAPFCYPAEMSHGYAASLLALKPDFFFMPLLRSLPTGQESRTSCTCVFVQGEPYYLTTAFSEFTPERVISPTLDFAHSIMDNKAAFEETAKRLGVDPKKVGAALTAAIAEQDAFRSDLKAKGKEALSAVHANPQEMAIVLFGRPYNSFADAANKGIPAKYASRGIRIIPFDMLPFEELQLETDHNMYWAMGRMILKAAHLVNNDSQLFGTYISNFSCGPDSFVISFFRDIMGQKPSLTLELDSHTADAGVETRIEAFLDIIQYYRQIGLEKIKAIAGAEKEYSMAVLEARGKESGIRVSDDQWVSMTDSRVKVLVPSMSRYGTRLLAKAFGRVSINAEALPPADEDVLKLGRGNSSCKECLPLQTTIGSILHYLQNNRSPDEISAYLMASAEGPCRFGQYHVFSKRVLEKHKIENVAMLSPTSLNGYEGLGDTFLIAVWRALVVGDLFDEMWSTILAAAVDREKALEIFEQEYQAILNVIDKKWKKISKQLSKSAKVLSTIELKIPFEEIPKISLVGEIYVRHDPISLQNLVERMADRGFVVRTAQNSEWFKFVDWLIKAGIEGERTLSFWSRLKVKQFFDRKIRKKLSPSGLFFYEEKVEVEPLIEAGKKFVSPDFTCETILTVGSALHEILHPSCGVISIGPFGCMPSRVAEAILNEKFTTTEKKELVNGNGGNGKWKDILEKDRKFPFLAIETDGNVFPQIIEARLEAFSLQAKRLSDMMLDEGH